jgi:hypothetical protein
VSTPPAGAPRTTSLLLLGTVALSSALMVVALYELPARLGAGREGSSGPPSTAQPASPPREESPPGVKRLPPRLVATETCPALRARYASQCATAGALPDPAGASEEAGAAPLTPERARMETKRLAEWAAPSREVLADLARRCELRLVTPAVLESQPPSVDGEQAAALGLTGRERAELDRLLRSMHDEVTHVVRPLFASGAGSNTPSTLDEMVSELQERPGSGFAEARAKLAQERAQVAPPPPSGATMPPGERFLRLWANLGDTFEQRLGQVLGAERARQLRFSPHAAGWTSRHVYAGCPDAD